MLKAIQQQPLLRGNFKFLFMLVLAIGLFSCNKLKDDLDVSNFVLSDWNPEYAIPLVNSSFVFSDFITEESRKFIKVDQNGLVSLYYYSNWQKSPPAEDFIFIDDVYYQHEFPVVLFPGGTSDTLNVEFTYQFAGLDNARRYDSIWFKSGTWSFRGKTNLNKDLAKLKITIPQIKSKLSSAPLQFEVLLNNPGGQQQWVEFETSINLAEYKLLFPLNLPGQKNLIKVYAQLVIFPDQNPDLSPYTFEVNGEMTGMKYNKLIGYLGNFQHQFIDSLDLRIARKFSGGSVQVGPGALTFLVEARNSIGVPIKFTANELRAFSPHTPPYYLNVYLFGEGNPNEFVILSPSVSQLGQSVTTNLDFSNTNLPEVFLNLAPRSIRWDFHAILNAGGDSTMQNATLDTSRIYFKSALEMKLFFAIEQLFIKDTFDFNYQSSNPEQFDYLIMRLNFENGFPLEAGLQAYFTDNQFNVIDSLIYSADDRIIAGGIIGLPPQLRVVKPAIKITDFRIDKQRSEKITRASKMILKAWLATTNGNLAKIYDDYKLKVKLGVRAGFNFQTNN